MVLKSLTHMKKPDFKQIRKMEEILLTYDKAMTSMMEDGDRQTARVRKLSLEAAGQKARAALSGVSVEELRKSRAGIRVQVLEEAGFHTLRDLDQTADPVLSAIDGIGEKQVAAIRRITEEFVMHMAAYMPLRIDPADPQNGCLALMEETARLLRCSRIREEAGSCAETLHAFTKDVRSRLLIRNSLKWLFSGREKKETVTRAALELKDYLVSPGFARIRRLAGLYEEALHMGPEEAAGDFETSSADFYALIETLTSVRAQGARIYGSIPEKLAAEISEEALHLEDFRGNLRAYQAFGTRYILHQKRVLLGDEMGLGKTIQAIAAMCHIRSCGLGDRFLIVCPASVLTNWCREINKFSSIPVTLLHGPLLLDSFALWEKGSGAAVTNYESMARISDRINNRMKLSLLVIDEAHYIKNPDAKRTANIRRLEDESERILLMTGTPVENRVEEMCSLIDFIRPDLADKARNLAYMRQVPEFKEILSPVYLRRLRDHVLGELPPVEEKQEWCRMTMEDLAWYTASVMSRNFTDMRRVAFHQEDLAASSKAARLIEICREAKEDKRKVVIYSFFRETIRKLAGLLKEDTAGVITGSTEPEDRQALLDVFAAEKEKHILICQIQAGGTGLNIQAASIVIFCEPQIKPSLTRQAIARVSRMGQIRNVLVFHLLCPDSVDEAMVRRLEEKQKEFDLFADGSALADAADLIFDSKWIKEFIDAEAGRYLPGEGSVPLLPDGKNLPAAAPAELLTSKDDIYPLKDYNKESREYL